MSQAEILVEALRNDLIDRTHRGHVAVVDAGGRLVQYAGDPMHVTYMRSSAKPLQAMALVETGASEAFDLDDREISVACASHSAQPEHVNAVQSMLDKAEVSQDELRCGSHPPIHRKSMADLYRQGGEPQSIHSNCSGKHSGMLAVCAHMGWPTDDYRASDHPLQELLLDSFAEMAGIPVEDVHLGIDGCGVPVFGVSVAAMARSFAQMVDSSDLSAKKAAAAKRVVGAMQKHPLLVAGEGRVCATLNGLDEGRFMGKGGALGVYCAASVESGLGVAVKIEDGNGQAAAAAALEALAQLALFTDEDCETLKDFRYPLNKNVLDDVVGEIKPVYNLRTTQI